MNLVCKKCGTDLSSGQIICAGRTCVKCYNELDSK